MATNEKKTFFLARSFDWPAEGGPVCLGSIIKDPKNPAKVINSPGFDLPTKIYEVEQHNWKHIFDEHRKGSATLFAEFLRMAELSGNPGARLEKLTANHFKCDKLVTTYFLPDDAYVMDRMQDPKIQASLKKSRSRAFMITGLKLAYNPGAYHLQVRNHGFSIRPGADLSLSGPPLKIGVALGSSTTRTSGISSDGGTDTIFAYQLMEIDYRVDKKTMEGKLKTKEFIKGAYMDMDRLETQGESRQEDEQDDNFVGFEKIIEYDVGQEAREVLDDIDGMKCYFVPSEPMDPWFG